MRQTGKIVLFTLIAFSLISCQGPGGRRIIGGKSFTNDPTQTGKAFRSGEEGNVVTPMFSKAWLSSLFGNKPAETTNITKEQTNVDYTIPDWDTLCKAYPGDDSDGDGLSDNCETSLRNTGKTEYSTLHPAAYNGTMAGASYFDADSTKLDLTDDQEEELSKLKSWKISAFGAISKISKKFMSMFRFLKKRSEPDLYPFKNIYYNYSDERVRIDERFVSYMRNSNYFQNDGEDQFIGLARGDGSEAIPSPLGAGNKILSVTAMANDTDSANLPNKDTTVMVVYEFFTRLQEAEVAIGYPSPDKANELTIGSRTAVYYLLDDNESVLMRNDLLTVDGEEFHGYEIGVLHPGVENCSKHLVLIQFVDAETAIKGQQLFPDHLLYRQTPTDPWKPFTQGMMSIQPEGGAACNQKYNGNDPGHRNMFFRVTSLITSRVLGAADFNTSLNSGKPARVDLVLSNNSKDSGSFDKIMSEGLAQISEMDATRLSQFKNSMDQIEKSGLTPDQQKVYDQVITAIATREAALDPTNQKISGLRDSVNGLAGSTDDPDFASKKASLLSQIAQLKSDPSLTPEQKKALEDLEALLNGLQPAAPETLIQLDPDGKSQLTLEQMQALAKLGFTFSEKGVDYQPLNEKDLTTIKKLTPEEFNRLLDLALEQFGKKLDSGTMSEEEKNSMIQLLDQLKAVGDDDAKKKIDQFMADHADDFYNWTPDQLNFLKALDGNKTLSPGYGTDLDTWSKGFKSTTESQDAKKAAADRAIMKLLDPSSLQALSGADRDAAIQERIGIARDLKKYGFLDDEGFANLLLKISALNNPKLDLSQLGKITQLSDGRLALDGAKILFDTGTNKIQPNAEQVLRAIAEYVKNFKSLQQGKDIKIKIEAYTDSDGDETKNLNLSTCRAEAVKEYFVGKGETINCTFKYGKSKTKKDKFVDPLTSDLMIGDGNITIEGKGEVDPIADNNTKSGKALNRRVRIILFTK